MPLNSDPVKKMIGLDIALKRFKLKSEPYTKAALVAERAAYEHSTMADARYQQSAYLFGPDELKELRQDGTQIVLTNLLDTWSAALSNAQGGDVKSKVTKMHLLYFTSVFSVLHMLIEFYLHGVHRGVSDWALYRIIMNFQRYLVWVCLWGYLNCDRTDIQWQVIQNLMSGDIVPPP